MMVRLRAAISSGHWWKTVFTNRKLSQSARWLLLVSPMLWGTKFFSQTEPAKMWHVFNVVRWVVWFHGSLAANFFERRIALQGLWQTHVYETESNWNWTFLRTCNSCVSRINSSIGNNFHVWRIIYNKCWPNPTADREAQRFAATCPSTASLAPWYWAEIIFRESGAFFLNLKWCQVTSAQCFQRSQCENLAKGSLLWPDLFGCHIVLGSPSISSVDQEPWDFAWAPQMARAARKRCHVSVKPPDMCSIWQGQVQWSLSAIPHQCQQCLPCHILDFCQSRVGLEVDLYSGCHWKVCPCWHRWLVDVVWHWPA